MEAIRRHYDSVGLFVLALASGLGGGLLRDGVFIQAGPPVAMRNWSYIIAVLTVCLIAALFFQHVERLSKPFLIIDAIPACIFVGVVNAVGSGLIRDVLVREEPLLFKPGQFYVIASLLGVTEFMLVTTYAHAPIVPAAISAIAITFVFRLLAIFFDWRTRPVMRPPPHN